MADVFSEAKRSEIMSRVRGKGNKATELKLIDIFRKHGIKGWRRGRRLHFKSGGAPIRISPDFVFQERRICVFVDGEFWHGHPSRCRLPETNRDFWEAKIKGNRIRDRRQNRLLRSANWTVVRIWQHELTTLAAVRKLRRAGLLIAHRNLP